MTLCQFVTEKIMVLCRWGSETEITITKRRKKDEKKKKKLMCLEQQLSIVRIDLLFLWLCKLIDLIINCLKTDLILGHSRSREGTESCKNAVSY